MIQYVTGESTTANKAGWVGGESSYALEPKWHECVSRPTHPYQNTSTKIITEQILELVIPIILDAVVKPALPYLVFLLVGFCVLHWPSGCRWL